MFILFIIFLILLSSFGYAYYKGAPWVPTWKKDLERIIKLAEIKPGQFFYELGCGDARLTALAAKAGAKARGIELSLIMYLSAKIRVWLTCRNLDYKIYFGDLFKQDLRQADIVYLFLQAEPHEKIKNKLERELRSGTKVITYVWPIPDWQPVKIDSLANQPKLYLYIKQ